MYGAAIGGLCITGSAPLSMNCASAQSAWSNVFPSPPSSTDSDQTLDAVERYFHFLGRIAAFHHAAFPQRFLVANDGETDRSLLLHFVINANHRAERSGAAIQIEHHFAVGVRTETVIEFLPADAERMSIDRAIFLWRTPTLCHLAEVERIKPERPQLLCINRNREQ